MYEQNSSSYKNKRCSELSTGIPKFDMQIMKTVEKCVAPWWNAYEAKRKK